MQFSIRYNEGVIARNSMVNGEWGVEERDGGFPLAKNEVFDITIINEAYSFQCKYYIIREDTLIITIIVFINGKRFGTFSHRNSNPADIETLEVEGSVVVF